MFQSTVIPQKINKLGYKFNLSSLDAIRKTIDELIK